MAPHDLNAEHALIGGVLLEGRSVLGALTVVPAPTDFYTGRNEAVWRTVLRLHGAEQPIDLVTVQAALHDTGDLEIAGGQAHLALCMEQGAVALYADKYAQIILDRAAKRQLLSAAENLSNAASNGAAVADIVASSVRTITEIGSHAGRRPRMLVSASEFAASPPPKPAWLVDQIVLQGANGWIGGPAKLGKSFLASDLCLACATGTPWLGKFAVAAPWTVVLISEEDSAWRTFQRIEENCRDRGVKIPSSLHLAIRKGVQLDQPDVLGSLLRELEEIRPDLVVWDVFNRLHSKDERRPDQMLPVLRTLDRIRDTIGCSNLVVHHTRKPSAHGPDLASGGQKLRGPSEFWGWAENSLYLSATKAKGNIIVEPESKDAMQEPFKVHLETGEGGHRWIFDGVVEAKIERGAETRRRIVESLRGAKLTAEAVADQAKASVRTVKTYLAALATEGVVDSMKEPGRAGRKLWMLVEAGDA